MIEGKNNAPRSTLITPGESINKDSLDLMVDSLFRETDPLLMMDGIRDVSEVLKTTHLSSEVAADLSSKLEAVSSKEGNTPLISLGLTYLKDCVNTDYLQGDKAKAKISKYFIDDLGSQKQLHEEYPALPQDAYVIRIAPNIASSVDPTYMTGGVIALAGKSVAKEDVGWDKNPISELMNDGGNEIVPIWLLNFAHDIRFRGLLEDKIGLNIADVSLGSQLQLLKFMTEADDSRFDKLCSTLHKLDDTTRLKLAENFLAADFGDDFGDALLDIASSERISKGELKKILDTVNSCRNSINGITKFYDKFDGGDFAKEYARAANERLTDAITVFKEIAINGKAKTELGRFGTAEFDYNSAMEALRCEMESLKIINGTMSDLRNGKEGTFAETVLFPDLYHGRSLYNFYSPNYGYVLLYTRPEGSENFDPSLEYGKSGSRYSSASKNTGIEASISLITNPIDPFSLPNPFKPDSRAVKNPNFYDSDRMDKVSAIRLDREGRTPGMTANDPERSPLNQQGMVSVDLAAIGDRVDTPSGKIARLFSAGNALRTAKIGSDTALNHNTAWFDQNKYGTTDGFRDVVEYVDEMAKQWCKERPPKETEGFRGITREANKRRGHKIITGPEAA